ncbi:MAG: hypothetical protein FDZ70_11350 [Actinobacteria bacterium]|nr:MAG: hypothetical protein FDZ70_11350 [Actinomycetota bacterium]
MVYTSKDQVKVAVMTDRLRIEGTMHVLAGSRVTDALNSKAKDFIAFTDAAVFSLIDDRLLYEPEYVAVNREAIAALFPLE